MLVRSEITDAKISGKVLHPLKREKLDLFKYHISRRTLGQFSLEYAKAADRYMKNLISSLEIWDESLASHNPPALIAVGGYGRGELCLESDLDILLVFEREIPNNCHALSKAIFYPLWDGGFEVGHGIRTIADCVNLAEKDLLVLTSLLDMRFIAGSERVYLTLRKAFHEGIVLANKAQILELLASYLRGNGAKAAMGLGFLEPNLKEGAGGLRNYHHIRWVHHITSVPPGIVCGERYDMEMLRPIIPHVEFIEATRNILHLISGRKYDILRLEKQPGVARIAFECGLVDKENTEYFLSVLLGHLMDMKFLSENIIEDLKTPIFTKNKVTYEVLKKGLKPDVKPTCSYLLDQCVERIKANGKLGYAFTDEMKKRLTEIIQDSQEKLNILRYLNNVIDSPFAPKLLEFLHRIGILGLVIKPFENIKNKVQYDGYHTYPVDVHLFEALRFLCEIEREGGIFEKTVFHETKNKKSLFWAALLHDIGKGAGNHHIKGARLARPLLRELGLKKKDVDLCTFLIRHHLYMAESATKKNLNEERVIVECASRLKGPEHAKMLYLLTWADSKATGPKAWNYWFEYLLQDLFLKVLHVFERGKLLTTDATMRSKRNLRKLKELLGEFLPNAKIEELFQHMGIRYTLENSPSEMKVHVEMVMELLALIESKKDPLVINWKEYEREKLIELTIVTMDYPGLFSHISGVISLHDLNIMRARAYTWTNGVVIDIFEVSYPPDPLKILKVRIQIEEDIKKAIKNELALDELILHKKSVIKANRTAGKKPEVLVDNNQSDFFTVVEVHSNDKMGLLYRITKKLHQFGLDIRFAKIGTKADLVMDYFYVKDKLGQKLTEQQKIQMLKRALLDELE